MKRRLFCTIKGVLVHLAPQFPNAFVEDLRKVAELERQITSLDVPVNNEDSYVKRVD